jgi:ubiquinone biosynthesis monooxygenase Coq7
MRVNGVHSMYRASSSLASARYLQGSGDPATTESPSFLTAAQRKALDAAIRVDQAGEVAANWIYKGQLAVLGRDPTAGQLIQACHFTVYFYS